MGENYNFDPICDDYPKIVLAQPFSRIFMVFMTFNQAFHTLSQLLKIFNQYS